MCNVTMDFFKKTCIIFPGNIILFWACHFYRSVNGYSLIKYLLNLDFEDILSKTKAFDFESNTTNFTMAEKDTEDTESFSRKLSWTHSWQTINSSSNDHKWIIKIVWFVKIGKVLLNDRQGLTLQINGKLLIQIQYFTCKNQSGCSVLWIKVVLVVLENRNVSFLFFVHQNIQTIQN